MKAKVNLIGWVGKDPEIKVFENGNKVVNFTLATTEKYKKDGELVTDTTWHNIVIYGKLAEVVEKFVNKGNLLYLEGKIKVRKYADKEGVERYITEYVCYEMVMLPKAGDSQSSNEVKEVQKPDGEVNETDDLPF